MKHIYSSMDRKLADKDIKAAKKLVNDDYLANIVLFHCQQCIEKSLKAILEESNLMYCVADSHRMNHRHSGM